MKKVEKEFVLRYTKKDGTIRAERGGRGFNNVEVFGLLTLEAEFYKQQALDERRNLVKPNPFTATKTA